MEIDGEEYSKNCGLFARMCNQLSLDNTLTNRRRLLTMWQRNSGNVRNIIRGKERSCTVDAESKDDDDDGDGDEDDDEVDTSDDEDIPSFSRFDSINSSPERDELSEILASLDEETYASSFNPFDDDGMMDLLERYRENKGRGNRRVIQRVKLPFEVILISSMQVQVALEITAAGFLPILHVDASGTMVEKMRFCKERIMMYTAICHWGKNLVPMFDILIEEHSDMRPSLEYVKNFITKEGKRWPFFVAIVVDFLHFLNPLMETFMEMTLFEYLDAAYEHSVDRNNGKLPTVALLCCTRYIKGLYSDVRKIIKKRELAEFYKGVFEKILNSTTFEQADKLVIAFFHVLLCSSRTDEVQTCFAVISDDAACDFSEVLKGDVIKKEAQDNETMYRRSPFYKRYKTVVENISKKAAIAGPFLNEYCNAKLADQFLEKHLSYLPLWTSYLSPTGKRISNFIVKTHFSIMKSGKMNPSYAGMGEFVDCLKSRSIGSSLAACDDLFRKRKKRISKISSKDK